MSAIPMPWYDTYYNFARESEDIMSKARKSSQAAQIGIAAAEIITGVITEVISDIVVRKSLSLCAPKIVEDTSSKQQLCVGDRIRVDRKMYKHYAIVGDIGKDGIKCYHYTDVNFEKGIVNRKYVKGEVRLDNLQEIVKKDAWRIDNSLDSKYKTFGPEKIVARARSKLGQTDYNLVTNNCETYANWCRHGEERSDQVRDFVGASVTAAVVTIAAAGTAAASSRAQKKK
ncbi:lecithin retinol acyltransferase domain-containing protein [Ditylenchus destructor]|uniref:Lecithin retinol acyltransferase domain-containing protein n=1 Tax=Ditylenchus destructor TaxID=166010 RepID=A0AAD4MRZ2_9BILA|nr:lecithin retinol acyltransferase domain-containing protein [Ditylenchus destructor]